MNAGSYWASNLFLGRIGEAIVEAVLTEFGYRVLRTGQEAALAMASSSQNPDELRYRPDLLVMDHKRTTHQYVEVKARSSRPMSVILEKSRLDGLRTHYPEAILVFTSAHNGSVNCASVQELTPSISRRSGRDVLEFDLLAEQWKPIWHFFPLVKPGQRLTRLWSRLQSIMQAYGEWQVRSDSEQERYDGEREILLEYIEEHSDARMLLQDIDTSSVDGNSLSELRGLAHKINAFWFALDLHGEENLQTWPFAATVESLTEGKSGEYLAAVDLGAIAEELAVYPGKVQAFWDLRKKHMDSHIGQEAGARFLKELLDFLPPGVGKGYLHSLETQPQAGFEVDIRTLVGLASKRNRLDSL